jgi:hypothetical protein
MTHPILIDHINKSNLDPDVKETLISSLGALDDWSEFGESLVKDLGIDWYCDKVDKYSEDS